jgi:Spy/CpxP family protein refolding chaperone
MKQSVLILVLAMSLLFNLFFAAGFMRARAEARRSLRVADPEAMNVARDLNLDESQQASFEQMRATMREEQVAFADSLALVRQELIDELNREQPDLEKVRFAVTRETDLLAQRRQAETARFSAFVGLLNPEQCRRLSQRLGGRGLLDGRFGSGSGPAPGHGGPGRPDRSGGPGADGPDDPRHGGPGGRPFLDRMQRFDANKDGNLDDVERAAARQALEERIRQDRERREETFKRFDADNDGKLDRNELEQMNRFMFEQWRDRPRPGGSRPPAGPPGEAEPAPTTTPAAGGDSAA